jgi:hypothetical protein
LSSLCFCNLAILLGLKSGLNIRALIVIIQSETRF